MPNRRADRRVCSAGRWLIAAAAVVAVADGSTVTLAAPPLSLGLTTVQGIAANLVACGAVLAASLLLAQRLGDLCGPRTLGVGGLALFGTASLGCATAGSLSTLLLARTAQAAGATVALLVAFELLNRSQPGDHLPRSRPRLVSAIFGTAAAPALGAAFIQAFSWRMILIAQAPIVFAAGLVCAQSAFPATLVEAFEAERRRFERDLHDGTQQRLVSLAMSLGLLDSKLPGDPGAAKPIVREARETLAVALEELRDLSHGIYPTVLTERGLPDALEDLCQRAAVPSQLDVAVATRPAAAVELAVYFVVSEALTNAVKHSRAGDVRITVLRGAHALTAEVVDDGIGGATAGRGSGLRGLTDRVEALGGRLTVSSPPGRGTVVRVEIPCA